MQELLIIIMIPERSLDKQICPLEGETVNPSHPKNEFAIQYYRKSINHQKQTTEPDHLSLKG